ncbi:isopeptide-forming domain-containing fimbrial protein [Ruminococcus sp. JL13D9]|uniref:isopeptide-forming domain-containing fimbrial protein n=1 Tax=Ruminococcus sp. JL13D9 TaxID=3233381 RepID=UPI00389A9A0D
MKKLTKIIAMTLAVLMLAAMTAVTCGAVSDAKGTVTVEKAVVGENLKFYRVLDYVDATGSYEVTSNFETFFDDGKGGYKTNDEIIAYLASVVSNSANARALGRELGKFAAANNVPAAATKTVDADTCTVSGLPYGYYVMAPELPGNTDAVVYSLFKLDRATVTISNKLIVPTPEKTVSDSDETDKKSNIAAIGEEMTFTVTGKVPDMSEYETYYFEIADTMTNMEYVAPMELTIGGTKVDISTTDSTANVYGKASGNSVNVKIKDLKIIAAATYDAEIKLTYKAKLTNSAVMGQTGNINEVKFRYSHDPATTGTGESPTSKTKTFTLGITVNKTDSDDKALEGSTWLLKKGNVRVAEIDGTALSKFDWKGLNVGTYTLTETAAPNNYTKMEGAITIEIVASVKNQVDTDGTYPLTTYTAKVTGPQGYVTMTNPDGYADIKTGITSLNVKNFQKGALPSTGGIGLYVILGLAGAAFAGMIVVLIIKKRISSKEK